MGSFFAGDVQRTPHAVDKIQNRRRPRRQHRLHHQPALLVQYRHRNRVPVDIHPNISHTVPQGVPFVALWLTASHSNRSLLEKGRPLNNACPTHSRSLRMSGPPWTRGTLAPFPALNLATGRALISIGHS